MGARALIAAILEHKNRFWLGVSLAVAFALRVYLLDGQSLWNDEGTSVALSALSPEAIVNGAARDIHPPLYYLMLHLWMAAAGQTEFAVRFFSALAGVLLVAVTFRIARLLFDEEIAILAAFLSAFSPLEVYYAQEARMYIWVALWTALAAYTFLRLFRGNSQRRPALSPASDPAPAAPTSNLPPIIYETAAYRVGALSMSEPRFFASLRMTILSPSRPPTGRYALATIVFSIAALYTHYLGASILVFQAVVLALYLSRALLSRLSVSQPPVTRHAPTESPNDPITDPDHATIRPPNYPTIQLSNYLTIALPALAFLPWYLYTRDQLSTWPAISEPFDVPTLLWRALNVLSAGKTLDPASGLIVAVAFAILFLIGLWPSNASQRLAFFLPRPPDDPTTQLPDSSPSSPVTRHSSPSNDHWPLITGLWFLAPLAVIYVISLSRPAYDPKFLLLAAPPFLILAARGLARIHPGVFLQHRHPAPGSRRLSYVYFSIAVLAAVGFIPSLQNYYSDPYYARDDYRAVLQYVGRNARPGDGLLVDAPGQIDVVRYYYRGDGPVFPLPRMRPPDPKATRADVDAMLGKVRRLFAVYYATEQSDPERFVDTRLAESAFKARDTWFGNIRLAIYGVVPPAAPPQTSGARLGGEVTLVAYQFDHAAAHAGDVVPVALTWRADRVPTGRYKVFVHLLDASNRVVAQRDGEPVADLRITPTWRAGETLDDHYGLLIEPGTPPGDYVIEVGMYRAEDGRRLAITAPDGVPLGDRLLLGTVRVE